MVGCCPFVRKFKRKDKKQLTPEPEEEQDIPNHVSLVNVPRTISHSISVELHTPPASLKPSSPFSSSGEFYDCNSEFSTSMMSSGHDPAVSNDHERESVSVTPDWNASSVWDFLGLGSSRNHLARFSRRQPSVRQTKQDNAESDSVERTDVVECASQRTVNAGQSRVMTAITQLIHHRDGSTADSQPNNGSIPSGSTFDRRLESCTFEEATEKWEPTDATKYRVRSKTYMRSRVKERCQGAFYDVIESDLISFPKKQTHVAKMIQLPSDPYKRTSEELEAITEYGLPTMLVVNMQLPVYQPSLFGACDGPGHSFVFYCVLKEHFNPRTFPNKAALDLFKRFVRDGRNQSQYRIKLIPKFLNVDEWAEKGPLTATEHRLVAQFNEKPILTRPYQHFFNEVNYFEIDIDVHSWLFVARKAFWTLLPRMHEVVTEVAMLIQGNCTDDLPEHIVAVARVYRVNLQKFRFFSDLQKPIPAARGEEESVPKDDQPVGV